MRRLAVDASGELNGRSQRSDRPAWDIWEERQVRASVTVWQALRQKLSTEQHKTRKRSLRVRMRALRSKPYAQRSFGREDRSRRSGTGEILL